MHRAAIGRTLGNQLLRLAGVGEAVLRRCGNGRVCLLHTRIFRQRAGEVAVSGECRFVPDIGNRAPFAGHGQSAHLDLGFRRLLRTVIGHFCECANLYIRVVCNIQFLNCKVRARRCAAKGDGSGIAAHTYGCFVDCFAVARIGDAKCLIGERAGLVYLCRVGAAVIYAALRRNRRLTNFIAAGTETDKGCAIGIASVVGMDFRFPLHVSSWAVLTRRELHVPRLRQQLIRHSAVIVMRMLAQRRRAGCAAPRYGVNASRCTEELSILRLVAGQVQVQIIRILRNHVVCAVIVRRIAFAIQALYRRTLRSALDSQCIQGKASPILVFQRTLASIVSATDGTRFVAADCLYAAAGNCYVCAVAPEATADARTIVPARSRHRTAVDVHRAAVAVHRAAVTAVVVGDRSFTGATADART